MRWIFPYLLLAFAAGLALASNLPTEPGVDRQTKAKMDWLEKWGTPIRYGHPSARRTVYACRTDTKVYLRKDWGIEQTWVNDQLTQCPPSFGN